MTTPAIRQSHGWIQMSLAVDTCHRICMAEFLVAVIELVITKTNIDLNIKYKN